VQQPRDGVARFSNCRRNGRKFGAFSSFLRVATLTLLNMLDLLVGVVSDKNLCLHDYVAGTVVVRDTPANDSQVVVVDDD
jgi:hypothetical protein